MQLCQLKTTQELQLSEISLSKFSAFILCNVQHSNGVLPSLAVRRRKLRQDSTTAVLEANKMFYTAFEDCNMKER